MTSEKRQLLWIAVFGGLAILAAGGLFLRAFSHYAVQKAQALPGAPSPTALPKSPPNPAHLSFRAKPSWPLYHQIAAVDAFYRSAAARWIAYRFRGIVTDGPNAGLISVQTVRLAAGIVPLPPTLSAAHIALPPTTPVADSIQLHPGLISTLVASARSQRVSLTQAQARALAMTTARAALAVESNDPLNLLSYLDGPWSPAGQARLDQIAVRPKGSLMRRIVGSTHGDLPNAVYFYRAWATVTPEPIAWIRADGTPFIAEARLTSPVIVDGVASAVHGGAIADVNARPFSSVTLGLLRSAGQSRWYVLGYHLNLRLPQATHILRNDLDANGF